MSKAEAGHHTAHLCHALCLSIHPLPPCPTVSRRFNRSSSPIFHRRCCCFCCSPPLTSHLASHSSTPSSFVSHCFPLQLWLTFLSFHFISNCTFLQVSYNLLHPPTCCLDVRLTLRTNVFFSFLNVISVVALFLFVQR